jgi:hypothetical protein
VFEPISTKVNESRVLWHRAIHHYPHRIASRNQGVEINPLLVATIQRLRQRTIESILPNPGTVSPRVAFQTPVGPSKTAVERLTSRTDHPAIVVGLVSETGARRVSARLTG